MAAPVIESSSTTALANGGTTVVITKPTGLTVGDKLVAIILSKGFSGTTTAPTPPGGWTTSASISLAATAKVGIFTKTADSGDTAASDFTFTVDNQDSNTNTVSNGGMLFRISGAGVGDPLFANGSDTDAGTGTALSGDISINTTYTDSLIMSIWATYDSGDTTDITLSTYTVSGTNPTWTEQFDGSITDGPTNSIRAFQLATAVIDTPRTLTTVGATSSRINHASSVILAVFPPRVDDSVTLDAITIGASIQTLTSVDSAQTLPTLTIGASIQEPNTTQITPKWSNTDKSSAGSITNTPKS